MIASLNGRVLSVGPTSAVVEVGGLGVLALCSPNTVAGLRVGQHTTLATSLIVREDSLTLYGFASSDEREFFELLLTASGVGPKLAQAALAVLSPDELRQAIASENLVQLCKVPGVGRKGAQRIVHRAQGQDQHGQRGGGPGRITPGGRRLAGPSCLRPPGPGLVGEGCRGRLCRGGISRAGGSAAQCCCLDEGRPANAGAEVAADAQ